MVTLDRTEQRIVGVLIEKQLSVPDSYPLSENALVDGCNQKNNREPVTELVPFQVAGALMALQEKGVVAKVDGGGRVPRFRHKLDEALALAPQELPILAELLLRGPQAPGALKPRVARMGLHAAAEQIEAALRQLAQRSPPLVELLPLAPRERDRRWRHLLGDGSEASAPGAGTAAAPTAGLTPRLAPAQGGAPPALVRSFAPASTPSAPLPASAPAPRSELDELRHRVAALEQQLAQLRQDFARLSPRPEGS